jgi:hypothetical protein
MKARKAAKASTEGKSDAPVPVKSDLSFKQRTVKRKAQDSVDEETPKLKDEVLTKVISFIR